MSQIPDKGAIRPPHSSLLTRTRTLDSVLILTTLYASLMVYDVPIDREYLLPGFVAATLFGIIAENNELYHGWRGAPLFDEALRILLSWLGAFMLLISGVYLYNAEYSYSLEVIELWLPLAPFSIILTHSIQRGFLCYLRKKGFNTKTYAIFGANILGQRLKTGLSEMPWIGYQFIGFFDDRAQAEGRRLGHKQIGDLAGGFQELLEKAKNGEIDHIYITLPLRAEQRISILIQELADSTASINIVPDFFTFNLIQSKWSNVQGIPVVSVLDTPFNALDGTMKRFEDLILCMIILPITAVPMLMIAIAIKLTSPGPIIFKQQRYGIKGEKIEVWKFRSMTVCENGDQIKQATRSDSRVTPLGAFLRKTSLDELPQFFNVLRGTMSVVGPRPHAIAHNEYYRKQIQGYMLRHKVKPGITGQAQVNGCRGETDTLDKMEARIHHDLEYLKQWSLWLDIKIVILTVFKGFASKQAY
ncbi:UDP-glucose:undecaprenyl-phosphate glucose-1-phosphate transferase WcaJ [Methyloglobulus morosus KoM1]|uniref:UDP-glucose:undecaprenyl-phosphate glucose-1-phosphate transferase WcaJ n=1 Tax=Methyloglobulus morosus KoM1 TaxID=1116472 RepID=V5BZ74_9GAMM|nr:undecaprenyl-phosphate glucose phosphotransferase [Methyloglobulus morosus]ESS71522.1 UDP-glucose:undecaprenyl-phosphate glucose-1-phosphate transferase WcaJ [Methyloglobulus morosus KoM1]